MSDTSRRVPPSRRYWSERNGRDVAVSLTGAQVRRLFASLVRETGDRDELQEHFGYECVDDGWVPGTLGVAVPERLLMILGRDAVWPVEEHAAEWDDDTLFDMVEFMHDHVSTGDPATGRFHDFSGCGWHHKTFKDEPARSTYRRAVNDMLRKLPPGYELTTDGEVVRKAPDGLAPLLAAAPRLLGPADRNHVEAAIAKYRARSSSGTDRRDAVRDLADVLEHLRSNVKEHMPSKDEAALFEIANKFWIRHNKPEERRDYDHEAWWSWLFYVYLSSIALVSHLVERENEGQAPGD